MQLRIFILLFWIATGSVLAQEKLSKADKYFYGYAYTEAIVEYQKQVAKGNLMTNHQSLNLADSYFQVGNYKKASDIYLDINKKDTIMSVHRFNKMLQSLSKTSGKERVKAFLKSKSQSLSSELVENADFNFELLESSSSDESNFQVFNVNGNSAQSDFSPTFYKEKLLFSSGRIRKSKKMYGPAGEAYLDIYVARINSDGNIVVNSNPLDHIPKSKYHKSTPYYSEALGRIFYILSNVEDGLLSFDENGKNALAIGMVDNDGGFRLLLKDLSTSFYYPFYQEATDRLFFAADFEGGYGGTDIYFVHTNNGQIMSSPINLGPKINSPGNEIAPYIFENSLYFSSDIFYGLGGMDIYKSNVQANDTYSIPVNLGSGINSTSDDFGFIIKSRSDKFLGYFASNRKGGKGGDDIYGFTTTSVPGLKTLILNGIVAKPSGAGIENASVRVLSADKKLIKEVVTNDDGEYQLEIPWRDNIVVEVIKERHSSFYKVYDKNGLEALQKTSLDIHMAFLDDIVVKKEGQPVLKLNNFFFASGRNDISPEIAAELDKIVDAVQRFPKMKLRIESHTDSRGSNASNKRISQKRSEAIKGYLLGKGVAASNIIGALGYGEEKIRNNCINGVYCLEFLHKQNLRTFIVVSNYDELIL
ncbi:MAG: cell envelope biogenesis protein OmpA [Maribacter sp.]|nr:MAG: cell envelope biogenesis protein OmpA [Maribacter sp.]